MAGGGGRAVCYKGEQGLVFALVHQDSPGRLCSGVCEHPQDTSDLGMDTSSYTVFLGLVGASHFTVSPKGSRGTSGIVLTVGTPSPVLTE